MGWWHAARLELLCILGPLADILPRVAAAMLAGVLALMAAVLCGRAVRQRRVVVLLGSWLMRIATIVGARLSLASLAASGARRPGWMTARWNR